VSEGIKDGQVWRRKKDGRLVVVTAVLRYYAATSPDIRWATVDRPKRTGACFEPTWLRNYEPTKAAQ
jgi:hypothetical protein